ncbi:hypothetical protein ABW20_dc0103610 [Dactylellina cionopaga]|nr:hypothetical protein ABW20_dc0103610 [Dactylellina cionopaga]
MSQSAPPTPQFAPRRAPRGRAVSICIESHPDLPSPPQNETTIAALIPTDLKDFWDLIIGGALSWNPARVGMPPEISQMGLALVRYNRFHAEKLEEDGWTRNMLLEHFKDIQQHCDDIASGKVPKPGGNDYVMSLTNPSHQSMRPFWVNCVLGPGQKYEIARISADEFMSALFSEKSKDTVYHQVAESANTKLAEIGRLGRYALALTLRFDNYFMEFGMRYCPLSIDEKKMIEDILRFSEEASRLNPLNFPESRQEVMELLKSAKVAFSGDRLKLLAHRYEEWGVWGDDRLPTQENPPELGVLSNFLPGSTIEQRKAHQIRHIYLVERHINAVWREIFYAIEHCMATQLACHQWVYRMMSEYHETVRKIKEVRKKPDIRLYIALKEQRLGKTLTRWG